MSAAGLHAATLTAALESVAAEVPGSQLARAAARLSETYRAGTTATRPFVGDAIDATAYAATRMPATAAALDAALRRLVEVAPGFAPTTLLDLGGGTGAGLWAAAARFPSLTAATVVDHSAAQLALGRRLAASGTGVVRTARWVRAELTPDAVRPADLVVLGYVLTELPPARLNTLLDAVASAVTPHGVVLVVEPGTPAGAARTLQVRDRLLAAGLPVLAPCPHEAPCPLAGDDARWCHMAVRVQRGRTHRQLKGGSAGWEDEKYAWVAAGRVPGATLVERVLGHPRTSSGLVELDVCTTDRTVVRERVRKRDDRWRAARDATWGSGWGSGSGSVQPPR